MRLAEELLVDVHLDSTRARILQRVGVAAMYVREADRARKSLAQAADLANELQLHSIASRACSALSNLMCHEFDDVMSQLWYAERAAAAAAESGDSLELQTALLQVASAEMRRGNAEESAAIEDQLVGIKSDPDRAYLLVAFKALRLAWDSRFGDAHRELSRCWNRMFHDFDRLVCGAQCALFLAIDGRRESSIQLTGEVSALADNVLVHGLFCTRYIALGMLLCVITETINERPVHADRAAQKNCCRQKRIQWLQSPTTLPRNFWIQIVDHFAVEKFHLRSIAFRRTATLTWLALLRSQALRRTRNAPRPTLGT